MPESPKRIVVYAPNWLGDAVMALPSIADIRRHYAEATLAVAARAGTDRLFRSVDGVDEVVALGPNEAWAGTRAGEFARILGDGRFDLAILLPNSYFSAWVVTRAGIPERWGYRTNWRGRLLTRTAVPPSRGHQADYYRELTTQLGIRRGPTTRLLTAPAEARRAADELLAAHGVGRGDEFVAMAPGASNGNAKQWPPSRYAELAGLVAKRTPSTVVVIGTSGDIGAARDIERALESPPAGLRLVNLAGRTSLDELMGVLSRSERLVTNDSGAMHLASALGRKVVAIFGATDEHATAPIAWTGTDAVHEIVTGEAWCRPCLLHDCPTDHRCMTSISAAAVAARLDEPKPAGARLVR